MKKSLRWINASSYSGSATKFILIGLHGKAKCGKGTAAKMILELFKNKGISGCIVSFAQGVKDFAYKLGWNGKKDKKGRRLLQLIGTEIGRECFHENYWVDKWKNNVMSIVSGYKEYAVIVCDDVRFDNEAKTIHKMGGKIIRIVGRGGIAGKHKSERGIDPRLVDIVIDNSYSKKYLRESMYNYLSFILGIL